MANNQLVKHLGGKVKPVLSLNPAEARRRVLNLYRAWYRQIPYIVYECETPVNERQLRAKVRELIFANKHITDQRVIDMLVVRGYTELNDTINRFKTHAQVMAYFNETQKPKDFLSKFLSGKSNE